MVGSVWFPFVVVGMPGSAVSAPSSDFSSTESISSDGSPALDALWEVPISGENDGVGRTSPTVVDGTVYIGSANGTVYAFDADSGAEEWRVDVNPGSTWGVADSPSVVDGTVFAASQDGYVVALEAETGAEIWRQDLSPNPNYGGNIRATTVADGLVFVHNGDNDLYALHAATGSVKWVYDDRPDNDGTQAVAPTVHDGTVYVALRGMLVAIDVETGDVEWETFLSNLLSSSPTVVDDTLYIGSGAGEQQDPEPGGDPTMIYNGAIHAFDASTGEERWEFDTGVVSATPTVADGILYVTGRQETNGTYAMNAADGSILWTNEDVRGVSSPTIADGVLYVGSSDGNLYALEADTGAELDSAETIGQVRSSPTVADGVVYVAADAAPLSDDRSHLYAFDTGTAASSEGSRVLLGTHGHHDAWADEHGEIPDQPITGCEVIDRPGPYALAGDIVGNETCIEIVAPNVHFDGMGYNVTGVDLQSNSYGIYVHDLADDVTVTNVSADGWFRGILAEDVTGFTLEDVTATLNDRNIELDGVTDAQIRDSEATNSSSNHGISIQWSDNVTVVDTVAANNDARGFSLNSVTNSTFERISSLDNAQDGMRVTSTSTHNTVANATIQGNSNGFWFRFSSDNNTIVDTTISHNTLHPLIVDTSNNTFVGNNVSHQDGGNFNTAIRVLDDNNEFRENTIVDSGDRAFELTHSATGTLLVDNVVRETETAYREANAGENHVETLDLETAVVSFEGHDVDVEPGEFSGVNPPDGLDTLGTYVDVADARGSPWFEGWVNLSVHYEPSPTLEADSLTLYRYDGDWNELESTVDTTANTVTANLTSLSGNSQTVGLFGVETEPDPIALTECTTIDEPGYYELQGDLSGDSTCIQVDVGGVTIDGNGYTITGDGSSDSQGIAVGEVGISWSPQLDPANVHVRDVTLTNWENGFGARNVEDLTVDGVTIEESTNAGLRVRDGVGVEISDVTVSNNGQDGLYLHTIHDSTIEYVTATGNDRSGIFFHSNNENVTIAHNVVTDNGHESYSADGIRILGDEMYVVNNTATGNNGAGIADPQSSVNNTYTHNTVANNVNGIAIRESGDGNVIEYTNATGNQLSGVYLDTSTSNVTAIHNYLEGNQHGLSVVSASDNWIENNTAVANTRNGFRAFNGQVNNTFVDNWAIDNERDGFFIDSSAREIDLLNNSAIGNERHGINVARSSNDATLVNNTVRDSGETGIRITDSDGVTLSGDTVLDSGEWAVTVGDFADENWRHALENVTGTDVTVGTASTGETTLDFEATDVAFGPAAGSVAPPEKTAVGTPLEVAGHPDDAALEVTFHYDASDLHYPDTLDVWAHDGSNWNEVSETIDTHAGTATATITESGTFGLYEDAPDVSFDLSIDGTNSPVAAGEPLEVEVTVENTGNEEGTQTVELEAFDGSVVDSLEDLTLAAGATHTATLTWTPEASDVGTGEVTVRSDDDVATASVSIAHDGPVTITESTTITVPGTYLLGADLTDDSTAIVIDSSDVVFDGQGHTIQGQNLGSSTQYGIHVGPDDTVTNVTVRNVDVADWDVGVAFRNVEDSVLTDVRSERNNGGFYLRSANDNEISNLTVRDNDFSGINVGWAGGFSHNNQFTNVTATGTNGDGIRMGSGSGNEFVGVDASANRVGVQASTGNNNFADVTADDNSQYGVNLESRPVGTTIDTVSVSGNGVHGIRIGQSRGNTLTNVTTTDNDRTGIYLVGDLSGGTASTNNELESVYASGNGGSGISLSNADYNELRDVTLENNSESDLNLPSRSSGNVFSNVTITDASLNAVHVGPDQNTGNTFDGVEIADSQGGFALLGESTTVTDLTVRDGSGTALTVSTGLASGVQAGGADNVVTDVSVSNLTGTGVRLAGESTNNTVSEVTLEGTTTGIVVGGSDNTVTNATVLDSETDAELGDGATNWLESLTLGNTTVSATGSDVRLNAAGEPGTLPGGVDALGHVVEITNTSDVAELDQLRVSYDETDLGEIEETSLRIWRYDTDGEWHAPANDTFVTGPDLDEGFVAAYGITEFSTFGVFGETGVDAPDTGTLEGTVTGDGSPLEGAQVLAFDDDGFGALAETASADSSDDGGIGALSQSAEVGSYDLSLPTGTYTLVVSAEDYLETTVTDVEITADGTTVEDVDLEPVPDPGTLSGTLTDDETSDTIYSGTITATNVDTGAVTSGSPSYGSYAIELAPGTYDVSVSAIGYEGTTVEGVTIEEDETTTLDVSLVPIEHAIFTYDPATAVVGEPVTFDASASTPPAGESLTYYWDFTSDKSYVDTTDPVTTYVYDEPGEYEVFLAIEDDQYAFDTTTRTVTVVEAPESNVVVYGADVDPEPLPLGDTLSVSANLYNSGEIAGNETLELLVDGEVVDTTTVTVDPGLAQGAATLEWNSSGFEMPEGELTASVSLSLNGFDLGTLNVQNAYTDVRVIAASASETELTEGEQLHVIGSIYQAGTTEGPQEIALNATNLETGNTTTIDSQEVTLSPGWYHLGALNITFEPEEAGTYELDLGDRSAGIVEVEPAESDIQVIAASTSEVEMIEGEEAYTVGSIYQAGNVEGTETIDLTATDTETNETNVIGSQEVTLSPGFYHLGAINISFDLDPGTYDLELGGRNAGTIEVEPAESDIQVIAASTSEIEMIEGEEAYTIGSIYQAGNVEGTETIELTATDTENETTVVGSQEVTLSPGFYHLGAINISFDLDPGTYDLELGGRNAGTIDVEPAESDIQVIAASTSEVEMIEGEEAYTIGSIYQAGNVEGTETINLTATDTENETTVVGSQEVTLSPGFYHLGAINISFELDPGTYDLQLGDRNAGTIEVEPAESDIQVIAASTSEVEMIEGEEAYTVGSIYQAGNVEGTETINLTATHVESNESVDLGSQEVTLSPGFYHLGALNITFQPDEPGTYDLELGGRNAGTIEVEPAVSDIQVIAASPDGYNLTVGEEVHVVGSIYQAGNVEGTEEIALNATHRGTNETTTAGTQNVTLSPGVYHLGALNISFEPDEAGTYDLELGGRNAGSVEVEASLSDIQVVGASVADVELIEGEQTYVVGSIYQAGEEGGTETIELTATHNETGNTTTIGSQDVTLSPGFYHLGAINITFEPDAPGTYDLQLGDRDAGWVEVEEAESDIQVIAASTSEVEKIEGEEAYTVGSIHQSGNIEGTETIELTATNTETGNTTTLGSQEVTLSPGFYHLGAINISFDLDPGTYDLELGDRNAGTIEVEPAESDIQVIAASTSEVEKVEGEEAYTVGSIHQSGNIEGTETIELTATNTESGNTTTLGSQEVTLSPGFYHLGAINISFELDPGTYDLELGDRNAGTIEVEPAESDIQVIAASTSKVEKIEGEEAYTVGSIHQSGNIEGTETIELTATNTETNETDVLGSQEVTLSPGFYHLGAINITFDLEPGTYDLELGDRNAGTIEVLAAESDIQVIAASTSEVEIPLGSHTHVIGSIYQAGTIDDPEEISLNATHLETGETTTVGSQSMTLSPGWYHLGALNITFEPDQLGTYELTLGDRSAGTVDVVEPVVDPSIADVAGHSSGYDLELETDVVYASENATVAIDVESDHDLESITLVVSSLQTTYATSVEATHNTGDRWFVEIPIDRDAPGSIPDDGAYELSVIAIDEYGIAGFAADADPLVIDREGPGMAVTLTDVDNEDATVVLESDEPLAGTPTVTATVVEPDGTTSSADVTMGDGDGTSTTFTGTLEFDESGNYTVSVTGTDLAGNEGSANASVVVNTAFTLADGKIVIPETGTSIDFDLIEDANEALTTQELYLALSENTVNANLDGSAVGVGFLTADLHDLLDYYLAEGTIEGATISMAIDEDALPTGASASDVTLHHHDGAGEWSPVDSSVTYDGGDPFVTATVHGFSTYGALIVDEESPTVTAVTPTDGSTLAADTDEVTVSFAYEDHLSGIDTSSVALTLDGDDVTGSANTSITASSAEHTFALEQGETYTVTLTVADEAGNPATETTTFSVATPSSGGGPSPSPGTGSGSGSGSDPEPEPEPEPEPSAAFVGTVTDQDVFETTDGTLVTVTVDLENVGDADGEHTVALLADGETLDSRSVSLAAGDTSSIVLEYTFTEPGTYALALEAAGVDLSDDLEAVVVEPPAEDADDTDSAADDDATDTDDAAGADDTESLPGFGLVLAVVVLLLVALLAGRTRD
ncbi:right-handed parallel beta-helix repeat-containing protein [Natronobiforma cellulositropha]|uniref:right-handed parallel beta-helix repeat-containing protein n=1 Tax=Natronobiforma cellulositropha TaxID=1679076 RepID=UPI0021D5C96D|nr:right-handed parallel beta-helix repeat-containing protein [Natronobiforma cellulositropha]